MLPVYLFFVVTVVTLKAASSIATSADVGPGYTEVLTIKQRSEFEARFN